jgi:uncharacterized protein (TIRG00374 family)
MTTRAAPNAPESATRKPFFWRLLLWLALLLGSALLVVHRLGDVAALIHTLRRAQFGPLAVALLLQTMTLLNQPALYQALYALVNLPIRWRDLAPVVWAAHFVNIVTPAAGLGGTALLIHEAQLRGFDMGRVTLANTLYFLFNFVWFVLLLGFSLVALFLWHDLKPYEVAAAALPMTGVVIALCTMWLVGTRPLTFSRLIIRLTDRLNALSRRVLRREALSERSTVEIADNFAMSVATLATARGRLLRPWVHAMLVDGLEIAVLAACFAAFPGAGREVTFAMLIAGYAIGTLFLVVSVTPQGLGVVEGVMTAVFVSFGVPLERAAVVVLVYRGLSFWLPLGAGFLASQHVLIKQEI